MRCKPSRKGDGTALSRRSIPMVRNCSSRPSWAEKGTTRPTIWRLVLKETSTSPFGLRLSISPRSNPSKPSTKALVPPPGTAAIVRMKSDGTSIVFSTYLGGRGGNVTSGLDVDGSGNIYVAGNTSSPDFPLVDAIQSDGSGFVTVLKPDGSGLLFSSYFGSTATVVRGSTIDSSGQI